MTAVQRLRLFANGGLLEDHLVACQQAAVDFTIAWIAVVRNFGYL